MAKLTLSTKSVSEKEIKRDWRLVDVEGKVLGRIASEIAKFLQGKHKVNYVPHLDMGDYVVVINVKKVIITGKKAKNKIYTKYSGYPGGLRTIVFDELFKKNPTEIIRHAVSGMLPKNKLRDRRLARLYIFADGKHPFEERFK